MVYPIFSRLAQNFPNIKVKLRQAGIKKEADEHLQNCFKLAAMAAFGGVVFLFLVLSRLGVSIWTILAFFPGIFIITLFYTLRVPDALIARR